MLTLPTLHYFSIYTTYKSQKKPKLYVFIRNSLSERSFAFILIVGKQQRGAVSEVIVIKKLELLLPSTFIPQIESRIAELEDALKAKQFAVKKNPSGLVRIVRQKNYLQFYKRSSPSDAQGTYMPRSQEKQARAIVQNDYDQKTIPAIEAEIKELKDFIKAYKEKCCDTVYKKLASTRKEVVTPLTMDDQTYTAAWLKVEYRHKKFAEDAPQLFTDNNEQVRSKSEVIIANSLKAAGVCLGTFWHNG